MAKARIQIIPNIHGKITRDGKISEPDIYYILEKWFERHPEIKKRKDRIRISSGRFTLLEGHRTDLVDASIIWGPDIDGHNPSEDADLYEYFLAEDQGDPTGNVGPAAERHKRQQLKLGKGVAFVKTHLRRLPQSEEIWEADIRPAPAPGNKGAIWEGLVLSNDGRLPIERMFVETATVNDMAQLLADAMRRPLDGEPRRPKTLRIRKRKEWADLLPHLNQIGIQVISAPRLASWDKVFDAICRDATKKPSPTPEEEYIEELYPTVAESVRSQGHIEIGDQQGIGFVARAMVYGAVVFEGRKVKTLAKAMSALEAGLADWFERECLSDD